MSAGPTQAVILAAGLGSRLGSLTREIPKSLLEVGGRPLLDFQIDLLHRRGVDDIVVVVGHQAETIEPLLDGRARPVRNPSYATTGSLASFWCAAQHLRGDVAYLHADTVFDPGIFDDMIRAEGDVVLPVDHGPCDSEAMKLVLEGGRPVRITKDIPPHESIGEFIGIALIRATVLEPLKAAAERFLIADEKERYFEDALQVLMDAGETRFTVLDTGGRPWREIDDNEDLEAARALFPANALCLQDG